MVLVEFSVVVTALEEPRPKISKSGRRLGIQAQTTAMHGSITDHSIASTAFPNVSQPISGNGRRVCNGVNVGEEWY